MIPPPAISLKKINPVIITGLEGLFIKILLLLDYHIIYDSRSGRHLPLKMGLPQLHSPL